ncbi:MULTISPECIES: ThiF family adenylyltransferase [unclassified Anaerobiospirillum]|uniref:tRNA threonylcarbamoyladenosine dehydratase n=1 Tax=unclassified Anaerobiospirillum TaxID=2647410 RepID=UPI001FF2AEF9|nr:MULTISPECIES: ThiF family adenylyltransferase [unclassified Anaerobiospirillum]MCK0533788.1 ThiF family adenylyltransferase [Anaerobiospirillum sp. NML120511]MCK0539021.1 ThiF family adenylyltransferase [Anaerobiospirillum sp. NML02-A-032]
MTNLSSDFLKLSPDVQQEQLERFKGVCALYGYEGFFRLQNSHVVVIGNGGVGSWIAESLTRTGVGSITLIDFDNIELSNSNRQLHTLSSTIGQGKSETLGRRLTDINPYLKLKVMQVLINRHNVGDVIAEAVKVAPEVLKNLPRPELRDLPDPHVLAANKYRQCTGAVDAADAITPELPPNIFVAEAIDDLFAKASTVDYLHRARIPVVSSGGAGGRIDPSRVRIADITEARGDQLIKRLRTELRRNYGYPKGLDENAQPRTPQKNRRMHKKADERFNILCSFSDEKPMRAADRMNTDVSPEAWGIVNPPKLPGFGASNTVTATAGLLLASVIIRWIVGTRISQ